MNDQIGLAGLPRLSLNDQGTAREYAVVGGVEGKDPAQALRRGERVLNDELPSLRGRGHPLRLVLGSAEKCSPAPLQLHGSIRLRSECKGLLIEMNLEVLRIVLQ